MTASTDSKTILLVEDDADIREVLADVLTASGFPPILARDGLEALTLLREGAREQQVEYALSNSFAFGGLNAVLAFRAA